LKPQSNTTQSIKLIRVYITGSIRHYRRLRLVYSLRRIVWFSAITGNIALSLRAGFWFVFVFVFMLWPVVEAKRSGVPLKANEPVYTHPYVTLFMR
jgi:hypothetical protein